jgi:hypothetical protein
MKEQAIYLELLVSGFSAIACYKARVGKIKGIAPWPRRLFRLTDRVGRLRRSWWLWLAMIGILALLRIKAGVPLVVWGTAALQFIGFLALPPATQWNGYTQAAPVREVSSRRHRYIALPVSEIRSETMKFFSEISPRL